MTEINLLDSLVNRLRDLFAGYTLLNKSGELQEVRIFAQYIPQPEGLTFGTREKSGLKNYNDSDADSNFPCIVVKLVESEDKEERRIDSSRVFVKLLFACYDDKSECQGYRDLLNMQERVRRVLLVERVLADRYRLEMPLKSRLLECETWPVYFAEMDLIFQAGRPTMRKDFVMRLAS